MRARKEPNAAAIAGVGFEFAGTVVVMALGGWWLDEKWGTEPWLLVTGMSVGLIGGVYRLWKLGMMFFK